MIERRVAIFSGFDTRVVAKVSPQLTSTATDLAFVKLSGEADSSYFQSLVARTLVIAERSLARGDVRLTTLLVSCLDTEEDREREARAFFPAVRRLSLDTSLRKDLNRSSDIASAVVSAFRNPEQTDFARSLHQDVRLLLPVRNTPCKPLIGSFRAIYERSASSVSPRVQRRILSRRGRPGFMVRDLAFCPATNDGTHPVRRCTDSPECDLKAFMRFGVAVPERFEFDVSSDTGLKGKTFEYCDGTHHRVTKDVGHINMRINDDHRLG